MDRDDAVTSGPMRAVAPTWVTFAGQFTLMSSMPPGSSARNRREVDPTLLKVTCRKKRRRRKRLEDRPTPPV